MTNNNYGIDQETLEMLAKIAESILCLTYEGITVVGKIIQKNNDVMQSSLVIKSPDLPSVAPALCVDDALKRISAGESTVEAEASKIANVYNFNIHDKEIIKTTDNLLNKENLFIAVVNREKNSERLKNIVHRDMEDRSLELRCHVGNDGSYAVPVSALSELKLTDSEAIEIGITNSIKDGYVVSCMEDMLRGLIYPTTEEDVFEEALTQTPSNMYVITSQNGTFGAAGPYIDCNLRAEISAKMPTDDYIILPSSIHECIAIPADSNTNVQDLLSMVKEVNATQVDPKERLSDNIYYVSGKDLKIKVINEKTLSEKITETKTQTVRAAIAI